MNACGICKGGCVLCGMCTWLGTPTWLIMCLNTQIKLQQLHHESGSPDTNLHCVGLPNC